MLPSNTYDRIEIVLETSLRNHGKRTLLKFEIIKKSQEISPEN